MDERTYGTIRNSLIDGGPLAYAVVQLKLCDFPAALRHYLAAPLPLLSTPATPLPRWLHRLIYVDRFDLVVAEQQQGDIGPGAAPADALLYLLSAPPHRLSEWHELRGAVAWEVLTRQDDWLLVGERQQLHRLLGCEPAPANAAHWPSLQLLQIMLRQWLLRQTYSDLLVQDNIFQEASCHEVALDFWPELPLREAARRRFPVIPPERRTVDAQLAPLLPAAAAANTPA